MYKTKDREKLLNNIVDFMQSSAEFEGLLKIGSCSAGFADIYSDIDLMAGCYDADGVKAASYHLRQFFNRLGACYIESRSWTSTAKGLSVYFENGLSADISFLPTAELPIRSPRYGIAFAKTANFADTVAQKAESFDLHSQRYGLDDSVHYRFINELRYAEIAILRKQFIFADIALSNARQLLLSVETVTEGKKLHQFKEYNSLSKFFIQQLEQTYPKSRNSEDMKKAKEELLKMYLNTVMESDYLTFDGNLLKLLNCFE